MMTSRSGLQEQFRNSADTAAGSRVTSASQPSELDAAVIGAGPYGLSAAVHLKAIGLKVGIYGRPMDFWANKMPAGMLLRSPRVASNIADPAHASTLDAYEKARGLPPQAPVPRESFVEYGRWFQRQLLPDSDSREITSIERVDHGFRLVLEDGEPVRCKRVVVAAGIGPFQRVPSVFGGLSPSQLSHCYSGCDIAGLSRKRVAVIGAGQSALECAALLHEAGGEVEVIARIPTLRWIGQHPRLHHLGPISTLLYSSHDVGPAGISRLVAYPNVMKRIPLKLRDKIRTRAVRPAGSRWLPARLEKVKLSTGRFVASAQAHSETASLRLDDGSERIVDHVLLGTGYSVDITRYAFWSPQLVRQIATMDGYPVLRAGFESSVPGLHFVGATAARSYGPLLYFVAGTEFASQHLTSKIRKSGVETTC
jgi:cation diffusion facilitator CzcD-associated flavoprotein CzcO